MNNTNNTNNNAVRILASSTGNNWADGRFGIERHCDCSPGNRSAECHIAGWHLVASSDDRGDAIGSALSLRAHGTYRVVDQDDYSVIAP